MTNYNDIIEEYKNYLEKEDNRKKLIIKMADIISKNSENQGILPSLILKLHFMLGFKLGLTREEIYEKFQTMGFLKELEE